MELAGSARTAVLAAAALGVPVGAIANSLIFAVVAGEPAAPGGAGAVGETQPLLVLTSGAHRVDVGLVARLLGVGRVGRASPEFVREMTGFEVGGVAPVGHVRRLRTLVDRALAAYDVVWASAGTPHTVFATTYDELVRITGGEPADVASY